MALFCNLSHRYLRGDAMNRRSFRAAGLFAGKGILSLSLCGAFFSGGCAAGVFFSAFTAWGDPAAEFLRSISPLSADAVPLWDFVFGIVWWHALALLSGLSLIGAAFIPALLFSRGLVFSFSLSLFVRVLGPDSVPVALRVFLPEALFSLPFLFLSSVSSLRSSSRLFLSVTGRETGPVYTPGFFLLGALCTAVPAALSVLTWLIFYGV